MCTPFGYLLDITDDSAIIRIKLGILAKPVDKFIEFT